MKIIITFNDFVKETKEVEQPNELNPIISENAESESENNSDLNTNISDEVKLTEELAEKSEKENKHILSFDKFETGN